MKGQRRLTIFYLKYLDSGKWPMTFVAIFYALLILPAPVIVYFGLGGWRGYAWAGWYFAVMLVGFFPVLANPTGRTQKDTDTDLPA